MRYFALNLSGGVRERSEGEGWWGWGGGRLSSPELLWCLFTRSVLGPVQHLWCGRYCMARPHCQAFWSWLASSGILMFCKLGCKIWKALGHSPGRFALAASHSLFCVMWCLRQRKLPTLHPSWSNNEHLCWSKAFSSPRSQLSHQCWFIGIKVTLHAIAMEGDDSPTDLMRNNTSYLIVITRDVPSYMIQIVIWVDIISRKPGIYSFRVGTNSFLHYIFIGK